MWVLIRNVATALHAGALRRRGAQLALSICFCAGLSAPLCALSLNQLSHPQRHDSRHTIDELEESWRGALLASNANAMAALLSEDYMAITPSGTVQNKEDALSVLRSGRFRIASLNFSDRKVRFYGSTAVVTSLVSAEATTADGTQNGNFRYTHVYARDAQGKWKIVSSESSRVREPGASRRADAR